MDPSEYSWQQEEFILQEAEWQTSMTPRVAIADMPKWLYLAVRFAHWLDSEDRRAHDGH